MRKFRLIIAATMIVAAATPVAHAYQNEPDGFRGFTWGTPKDQVDAKVDFTFNRNVDPNMTEYRSRRDLTMNGIELTYNFYDFYKGRFMAGTMTAYASHCDSMLQILVARFGAPTKKIKCRKSFSWEGAVTTIVYDCDHRHDECRVAGIDGSYQ